MKVIVPTKFNYEEGGYSRSTIATYYDQEGILSTADVDELRINYDPATLKCLGSLLELETTNYCLYSEDYSNNLWNKSGISLGSSVIGPDNLYSSTKIVETGSSAHIISQTINNSFSGIYCFSNHVRPAERTKLKIEVSNYGNVIFDLVQKTKILSGNIISADIKSLKNGWLRISLFLDFIANSIDYKIGLLDNLGNSTYTATAGYGMYIFGSQIEYNKISSYIKTTSTPGYRAADLLTGNVAGIYYSNIIEDEYPIWGISIPYVVDNVVIREHRIYKCVQSNTGLDPLTSTSWEYVKPTNRWAAFDLYTKRSTTRSGS